MVEADSVLAMLITLHSDHRTMPVDVHPLFEIAPTAADMLGPFYVAGAPERSKTGDGLAVEGFVRSTREWEDGRPVWVRIIEARRP